MRRATPMSNPSFSQQAVIRHRCNWKPFLLKMRLTELKPRTVVIFEPVENVRFRRQNGRRAENVRILA